jgi:hypothetical protein
MGGNDVLTLWASSFTASQEAIQEVFQHVCWHIQVGPGPDAMEILGMTRVRGYRTIRSSAELAG